MNPFQNRRAFLSTSAATAGSLAFLAQLPRVGADDVKPNPGAPAIDSGIEPLVKLLEETPRNKLLEEVGHRIKNERLSYRELLAALLLAGVRNVEPRPSVGFKFHAVLVVNSAHQAAMAGPDRERWLPLFWALDNFKSAQERNKVERDGWRMAPVDESKLPTPAKARDELIQALDEWDEERADRATAVLARTSTPGQLFDLYARYGARDFRSIGHKAIFVANAFRSLEVIGWHRAEPVLRSLTYALLNHDGKNPAKNDLAPDRPGRRNQELIKKIQPLKPYTANAEASTELLLSTRTADPDELCDQVVSMLNSGVSPQAVWDGLFLAGAELLMRQPGIVALHSLTTLNALHYAARTTGKADTKKFLTLQAAAFVPLFREGMQSRGEISNSKINELMPAEQERVYTVDDVFDSLSRDKQRAAREAMAYLSINPQGGIQGIHDEARRLIFLKGRDSHDYKFSSAILEDVELISPAHRDRFLSASLFWLKGAGAPDSPVLKRTRAALA